MLLFFSFGSGEIFLIIIVMVVVFGPKRIPEVARNLGKIINEMKTASSDFKNEIDKEVQRIDRETRYTEFLKEKKETAKQAKPVTEPDTETEKTKENEDAGSETINSPIN
jgi:Tat protein translocase TatB subunit